MQIPPGRLLPLTVGVIAALLGVKTASLGLLLVTDEAAAATAPGLVPWAGDAGGSAARGLGRASDAPVPAATTRPMTASPPAPRNAPLDLSPADASLFAEVKHEREELARRETALAAREAAAAAASNQIDRRMAALDAMQQRMTALDAAHRSHNEAAWTGLVRVYEAMRPGDAANIFNALELHTLLSLLDRMNDRKAALVLAAMQPERARLATQMLAQQRQEQDPDPVAPAPSAHQG